MNGDDPLPCTLSEFRCATPDAQLHVTAFELELGDFFLFQKLYEFLDLFEVHAFEAASERPGTLVAQAQEMRGSLSAHLRNQLQRNQVFRAWGKNPAT